MGEKLDDQSTRPPTPIGRMAIRLVFGIVGFFVAFFGAMLLINALDTSVGLTGQGAGADGLVFLMLAAGVLGGIAGTVYAHQIERWLSDR
jgi:hypothetical protein